MLAVALPSVVQGQAAQPYAVPEAAALLPWSQQITLREDWLTKRHALLLPMMRRHKIGMWIVVNEEFHDDPLSQYVAPPRPYTGNRDFFVFIDAGEQGLKKFAITGYTEENLARFFDAPFTEPRPPATTLRSMESRCANPEQLFHKLPGRRCARSPQGKLGRIQI